MKVKPFLKWAGGKSQLIGKIEQFYPFDSFKVTKYAEPFVGGGAILFDLLNKYELESVYISDINEDLINTYKVIQLEVNNLISLLEKMQYEFITLDVDNRKDYYIEKRKRFNELKCNDLKDKVFRIEKAALMIFLNKTCFNGLYRVNKKGQFNVPIGKYKNPLICDKDNLKAVAKKLENIQIVCADYKNCIDFVDENTFVYFDPPYRPLNPTSSFTAYTEYEFADKQQIELAEFINVLDEKGAKIVVSNSDPKNINKDDEFFDEIYNRYKINRVEANRMINSKGNNRGKITEILVSNFNRD